MSFYIQLIPVILEFDGTLDHKNFNLGVRLKNYSNEMYKSYRVFKFFVKFLDQICDVCSKKV